MSLTQIFAIEHSDTVVGVPGSKMLIFVKCSVVFIKTSLKSINLIDGSLKCQCRFLKLIPLRFKNVKGLGSGKSKK